MPKFELGRVVATPGALRAIRSSGQSPTDFLRRHVNGDVARICRQIFNSDNDL